MMGLSVSVNMFLGGQGARGRCVGYKLKIGLASSNMVLGVVLGWQSMEPSRIPGTVQILCCCKENNEVGKIICK